MFQQTYTRQMSTSPPPFSYNMPATTPAITYSSYPQQNYCSLPNNTMDLSMYPQYIQSVENSYHQHGYPPQPAVIKSEWDDDINPFAASYSSLNGFETSAEPAYRYVSTKPHPQRVQHPGMHRSYTAPTWIPATSNSG